MQNFSLFLSLFSLSLIGSFSAFSSTELVFHKSQKAKIVWTKTQCRIEDNSLVISLTKDRAKDTLAIEIPEFSDFIPTLEEHRGMILKPDFTKDDDILLKLRDDRGISWSFLPAKGSSCQIEFRNTTLTPAGEIKSSEIAFNCAKMAHTGRFKSGLTRDIEVAKTHPILCKTAL